MNDEKAPSTAHRLAVIDAKFTPMAVDREYQSEAAEITEEFRLADREALSLADRALPGGDSNRRTKQDVARRRAEPARGLP